MPVVRASISASPIRSATFIVGGFVDGRPGGRSRCADLTQPEPNSIRSRSRTILACMPIENWWMNGRPLAVATSTAVILPAAKASIAASKDSGMPSQRANRFIVPAGSTASALCVSFRQPAAAEIVPSPPPARITSAVREDAALASASTTCRPATTSTSRLCPAASSLARMRALNASRSVVRNVPPSRLSTARKCMTSFRPALSGARQRDRRQRGRGHKVPTKSMVRLACRGSVPGLGRGLSGAELNRSGYVVRLWSRARLSLRQSSRDAASAP